jgi:hypothetical protein
MNDALPDSSGFDHDKSTDQQYIPSYYNCLLFCNLDIACFVIAALVSSDASELESDQPQ